MPKESSALNNLHPRLRLSLLVNQTLWIPQDERDGFEKIANLKPNYGL